MGKVYEFIVPGEPIPWSRPRFNRKTGAVFNKARMTGYEKRIAAEAWAYKVPSIAGPVGIIIQFYFEWPKAKQSKKSPRNQERMGDGPDVDNMAKAVLDGLKQHFNDRQVSTLVAHKFRSKQGEGARTHIWISPGGM